MVHHHSTWVNRFQLIQWLSVLGFIIIVISSSLLPDRSIYFALGTLLVLVVGCGIPKNYYRDIIKGQCEIEAEKMYRTYLEAKPGEVVPIKDLDESTIDRFFEMMLQRNIDTEYYVIDSNLKEGWVNLKKNW